MTHATASSSPVAASNIQSASRALPNDSSSTDDSSTDTSGGDSSGGGSSTDEETVSLTPTVDRPQATVGAPPQEALAYNDADTSWTDGTAVA